MAENRIEPPVLQYQHGGGFAAGGSGGDCWKFADGSGKIASPEEVKSFLEARDKARSKAAAMKHNNRSITNDNGESSRTGNTSDLRALEDSAEHNDNSTMAPKKGTNQYGSYDEHGNFTRRKDANGNDVMSRKRAQPKAKQAPIPRLTIGISGPPSSGKTTLTNLLRHVLSSSFGDQHAICDSVAIHQDDYFKAPEDCIRTHFLDPSKRDIAIYLDQDRNRPITALGHVGDIEGNDWEIALTTQYAEDIKLNHRDDLRNTNQVACTVLKKLIGRNLGHNEPVVIPCFDRDCLSAINYHDLIPNLASLRSGEPFDVPIKTAPMTNEEVMKLLDDWDSFGWAGKQTVADLRKHILDTVQWIFKANIAVGFPGYYVQNNLLRPIGILEGFLLFPEPSPLAGFHLQHEKAPAVEIGPTLQCANTVFKGLDIKCFISELRVECRARRFKRPEYMEVSKGGSRDPQKLWQFEEYFDGVVWRNYEAYNKWLFAGSLEGSPSHIRDLAPELQRLQCQPMHPQPSKWHEEHMRLDDPFDTNDPEHVGRADSQNCGIIIAPETGMTLRRLLIWMVEDVLCPKLIELEAKERTKYFEADMRGDVYEAPIATDFLLPNPNDGEEPLYSISDSARHDGICPRGFPAEEHEYPTTLIRGSAFDSEPKKVKASPIPGSPSEAEMDDDDDPDDAGDDKWLLNAISSDQTLGSAQDTYDNDTPLLTFVDYLLASTPEGAENPLNLANGLDPRTAILAHTTPVPAQAVANPAKGNRPCAQASEPIFESAFDRYMMAPLRNDDEQPDFSTAYNHSVRRLPANEDARVEDADEQFFALARRLRGSAVTKSYAESSRAGDRGEDGRARSDGRGQGGST